MKICILTHSLHNNYGGILQAYALQYKLRGMGHDVVTVRDNYHGENLKYTYKYYLIRLFIKIMSSIKVIKYIRSSNSTLNSYINSYNVGANNYNFINRYIKTITLFEKNACTSSKKITKYDVIIVGSDQVWRPLYVSPYIYMLEFIKDLDITRIAYAASFGVDTIDEYSAEQIQMGSSALKRFKAISVREDSGVKLCKEHFGVKAEHLLDPTMLLNVDDYIRLIESSNKKKKRKEKIIMCYILDKNKEKMDVVNHISTQLNLEPIEVMPKETFDSKTKDVSECVYPHVSEWLAGFRDAEYVITDSFHGTVFAIIFNISFIAINNSVRGSARFDSLLKMYGLENRLISSVDDLTENHLKPIDYERINKIREEWKIKSLNFLKTNLT